MLVGGATWVGESCLDVLLIPEVSEALDWVRANLLSFFDVLGLLCSLQGEGRRRVKLWKYLLTAVGFGEGLSEGFL